MKFSLDESARSEIRGFFEEAVNQAGDETMKLFEELVTVYSREKYKPLVDSTAKMGTYYTEEFPAVIRRQFENWQDSDTSITAFADELEASDDSSDDAYVAAQTLEGELLNVLEEFFTRQPDLPSTSTESTLTKDLEEIYEELEEAVKKFVNGMEDLGSDYESKAESKAEDNRIYANVSEVLAAFFGSFRSLFDEFGKSLEGFKEHIAERAGSAVQKSESDRATMKAEAENAGEALRDISGLFDFE